MQFVRSETDKKARPVCRVCGAEAEQLWVGRLLDVDVQYYECARCGYVQTENPYWLDRAYANAINDSDTGIIARNLINTRIVIATLWLLGKVDEKVVDYAGGYGILVRLLRDQGIDALWSDPYCDNVVARGFEHTDERAALVTAFEAFEHFVDPSAELKRMLSIAPNVLLSTLVIPTPAPPHGNWWYYGREHGQHVGLYRVKTLRALAEKHGKTLVTDGNSYHLITDKRIRKTQWRLVLRANRIFPALLRNRLSSRTWNDHLAVSDRIAKSS